MLKVDLLRTSPVKLGKIFYGLMRCSEITVSKRGRLNGVLRCDSAKFASTVGIEALALVKGLSWERGTFSLNGIEILTIGNTATTSITLDAIITAIKENTELRDTAKGAVDSAMERAECLLTLSTVLKHSLLHACKQLGTQDDDVEAHQQALISRHRDEAVAAISDANLYRTLEPCEINVLRRKLVALNNCSRISVAENAIADDTIIYVSKDNVDVLSIKMGALHEVGIYL